MENSLNKLINITQSEMAIERDKMKLPFDHDYLEKEIEELKGELVDEYQNNPYVILEGEDIQILNSLIIQDDDGTFTTSPVAAAYLFSIIMYRGLENCNVDVKGIDLKVLHDFNFIREYFEAHYERETTREDVNNSDDN